MFKVILSNINAICRQICQTLKAPNHLFLDIDKDCAFIDWTHQSQLRNENNDYVNVSLDHKI